MLKRYKYDEKLDEFSDDYELISKEQFMDTHAEYFTEEELNRVYEDLHYIDFVPDDAFDVLDYDTVKMHLEEMDSNSIT